MLRHRLTDEQWDIIADLFTSTATTGRPPRDRRQVFDGILWILNTGVPWRDLPNEFGPWSTVWDLFDAWNHQRHAGQSAHASAKPSRDRWRFVVY